jgi:hypothetical protein
MYCIYSEVPEYILVYSLNGSTEDTTNKICLICWESSELAEPIKQIKDFTHIISICDCNAKFHASCFNAWITNTSSCPICRTKINANLTFLNNNYYIKISFVIVCLFDYVKKTIKFFIFANMANMCLIFLFNLYGIYNYEIKYLENDIDNTTIII